MEKQCITIPALCSATVQHWRVANGVMKKTMHYNIYFMQCNNATVKSCTWRHAGKQWMTMASLSMQH